MIHYSRARHHVDAAHYAESDALELLDSASAVKWASVNAAIADIENAAGMTARARVEQVRALVALLTWGLS